MTVAALAARIQALLSGEWARAISWGAILMVWAVTHAAFRLGLVATPPPAFDQILAAVSAAIVLLTELTRRGVYSQATVDALVAAAQAFGLSQAGSPPPPPDPTPAP